MKSQIFNVHPIFELVKSLPVADFTAGDLTMTHQMRRGESGRKLCENPMKSIQPRSSPPKTRCSPLETSLAFSTPPFHSIPLFPPFSPSLPSLQNHSSPASLSPAPKVQTRAELPCFLDNSFFFSFSASSSAAMSEVAPVVDAEYMAEIERARRDLRALIASKNCAPIMLRLAYVLSLFRSYPCAPSLDCCPVLVSLHFLANPPMAIDLADGMTLALTTPRPRPEAPTDPSGSHRSTATALMQGSRLPLTF